MQTSTAHFPLQLNCVKGTDGMHACPLRASGEGDRIPSHYNNLSCRRTHSMRRLALFLVFLFTIPVSFAQTPAFDRAASLRHGINLSGWFASSGDLSQQHFDTFTNEADLKLIHEMGFDSVRLGVEPSLIVRHG